VIVNGTTENVLTNDQMSSPEMQQAGCFAVEIKAPANLNAATMRNQGIRAAHGDWILPIDDDDFCHPLRLLYQMAHRRAGHPCLLRYQLRVDVSKALRLPDEFSPDESHRPLLHLLKLDAGVPSTLLFPRLDLAGKFNLYRPELNVGEHDELLSRLDDPVVCDNMHTPFNQHLGLPLLSTAIYHGNNELTYVTFLRTQQAALPKCQKGCCRPISNNSKRC
jgi:glycosyltransferase involved in cell wall biosynthesis